MPTSAYALMPMCAELQIISFWSWTTKLTTLLLGVLWKEVTECGTLFPSQHSVQLGKRERKICWGFFFSLLPTPETLSC